MNAEILATGDEIRTGALVDSNSAFIADQLEQQGVAVIRHHCVGDDLAGLETVITVNDATRHMNFDGALLVVDQLGEPAAPMRVLAGDAGRADFVDVALLRRLHAGV